MKYFELEHEKESLRKILPPETRVDKVHEIEKDLTLEMVIRFEGEPIAYYKKTRNGVTYVFRAENVFKGRSHKKCGVALFLDEIEE